MGWEGHSHPILLLLQKFVHFFNRDTYHFLKSYFLWPIYYTFIGMHPHFHYKDGPLNSVTV